MLLKLPDTVQFDPNNKNHREAVYRFRQRRAWADSSLRFTYDPNYGSVANQVESKLLQWHLEREFKKTIKKVANND